MSLYIGWLASLRWDGASAYDESQRERLAEDALREFDVVGTTEHLDGAMDQLRAWVPNLPKETPRLNITEEGDLAEITPDAIAIAKKITARDATLHRLADELGRRATTKRLVSVPTSPLLPPVEFGRRHVEIADVKLLATDGLMTIDVVDCGQPFVIEVRLRSSLAKRNLTLGLGIRDRYDRLVFGTNSRLLGRSVDISPSDDGIFQFVLFADLSPGAYTVSITLHEGLSHLDGCEHWRTDALALFVKHSSRIPHFDGVANLACRFGTGDHLRVGH